MRDYSRIEIYLNSLQKDIYAQPPDPGHNAWASDVINRLIPTDVETVLDVGCGQGFCKPLFEAKDIRWTGVTLGGTDFQQAKKNVGGSVQHADATFLPFSSESFDLVFARHILEHSPMPLLTLMEWNFVAKKWLLLVAPSPEYWNYNGKNHYSVLNKDQLWWLLARAGWKIVAREEFISSDKLFMDYYLPKEPLEKRVFPGSPKAIEMRFLCLKDKPKVE